MKRFQAMALIGCVGVVHCGKPSESSYGDGRPERRMGRLYECF